MPGRAPSADANNASDQRLRVTGLFGFVGAGKSAILRELIAYRGAKRLAVLVHDRSDPSLPHARGAPDGVELFRLGETLAELVQRCVGCSLRESLAEAIAAIARLRRFHRLIVECSGLAEPITLAEAISEALADKTALATLARLDHLVTVVNGMSFWEDMHSADALQERGLGCGDEDERTLSELLVDQVEFASTVIVNRADLAGWVKAGRIVNLVRCLNPEARVLTLPHGRARVGRLLDERSCGEAPISFQPGWVKLIDGAPLPSLRSPLWTLAVFRATRPFHPQRLWALIEQERPGVMRCKGYFWLASQPERCFLWSQTAGTRHYRCLGDWWVATPQDQWPSDDTFHRKLSRDWTVEFGDRRQLLACIGYRLDWTALLEKFRACLLTSEELLLGEDAWRRFDDPFARASEKSEPLGDEEERS